MFCKNCGKEIMTGEYCENCQPAKPQVGFPQVGSSMASKLFMFGLLAFVPMLNLFVNIINYDMSSLMAYFMEDTEEGFSFFIFVTTFADFKVLDGTTGYVMLSMVIMLTAGIRLAVNAVKAITVSKSNGNVGGAYQKLSKECKSYGILSIVAMVINYVGHSMAISDLNFEKYMEISIPVVFLLLSAAAIALGVVMDKNANA